MSRHHRSHHRSSDNDRSLGGVSKPSRRNPLAGLSCRHHDDRDSLFADDVLGALTEDHDVCCHSCCRCFED